MPDSSPTNSWVIDVRDLVKRYAGRTAVAGISFQVARGEILGLLGPNGAGKSTIIRVLAGYLPATSGTVRVAGFDVFYESAEVRRRIGYMPENNPLHLEMRVREYLKFRAQLKGLARPALRSRIDTVMEQCALTDVSRKIIGQLSKGYRQRVGLADALVHDPELIILDEPTIGLDPRQIRSVRQVIKNLAGSHTVVLSTHLLPEVEMTCSRVVILNEGKILAADTAENLQNKIGRENQIVAEIAAPLPDIQQLFDGMKEIERSDVAPADGEFYRCALTTRDGADLRATIFAEARERGWVLRELTRSRPTLEDVFVHVIRNEKEDEEND